MSSELHYNSYEYNISTALYLLFLLCICLLGRIVGLTGNALPEDIEIFMKNGANLVLTKPIDKSLLLDELMTILVF